MTDKQQPEALRLADELEEPLHDFPEPTTLEAEAAAELRRQYAEIETLRTGYAAARLEIESLRAPHGQAPAGAGMGDPLVTAAPAAVTGPSEAVAYLDVGAGGYLDLGTDLTDEALSRLPKGRHALIIAGTYGIDGYTAAPTTQPAPAAQVDALSDAVRVPLDSLHADAAYLIGRLRAGSMPYARVIEIIRERIDAAKAAIRARAAQGDALDAARYRWLREGNDANHGAAWHIAVNLYGCEWDAAIDAALAAHGGSDA